MPSATELEEPPKVVTETPPLASHGPKTLTNPNDSSTPDDPSATAENPALSYKRERPRLGVAARSEGTAGNGTGHDAATSASVSSSTSVCIAAWNRLMI